MSEPIEVVIEYAEAFSKDAIERILTAVRTAVSENLDGIDSDTDRSLPYWSRELNVISATDIFRELSEPNLISDSGSSFFTVISHHFSMFSAEALEITFCRRSEMRSIDIQLSVLERARYENEGSRERARMEHEWDAEREKRGMAPRSVFEWPQEGEMEETRRRDWWDKYNSLLECESPVWPQNRRCLLNVIDHLKQALPVKEVRLDPRLIEES